MQRIYLPNTKFSQKLYISDSEIHHQITRVMRARVGQEYIFFDGITLQDFVYKIEDISKTEIIFSLKETCEKHSELGVNLSLYQAIPNKIAKLEYIIQKATEVGYIKIVFFESERSEKNMMSEKKIERFKKIALEATEQCGGNIVPQIFFQNDILGDLGSNMGKNILCHTQDIDAHKISDISWKYAENIHIIVGPEGGFSDSEIESFSHIKNLQKVYFGDRILRSETVGSVIGFYLSQK